MKQIVLTVLVIAAIVIVMGLVGSNEMATLGL